MKNGNNIKNKKYSSIILDHSPVNSIIKVGFTSVVD